jgi:hypothetical protein
VPSNSKGFNLINSVHYVYWGRKDTPFPTMKLGMTARLDNRITNTGIILNAVAACISRKDALRLENTTRAFVRRLGGVSQQWEKDWFQYDEEIYNIMCEKLPSGELHQLAGVEFVRSGRMDEIERITYIKRIKELEEEIVNLVYGLAKRQPHLTPHGFGSYGQIKISSSRNVSKPRNSARKTMR